MTDDSIDNFLKAHGRLSNDVPSDCPIQLLSGGRQKVAYPLGLRKRGLSPIFIV